MSFPKSRILETHQLIRHIMESNENGERFCFVLGAGASVESGIPSGNTLEMRWMDCIMGEKDDVDTKAMDANFMREWASVLQKDGVIKNEFETIELAWKEAKENNKSISSEYYFDIYKLRFYPNIRNGYRYLENIMEMCEPSLGYRTLALLLTKSNQNNLIITTNFDSLVEDALFLYTNKKPLVVSHESLASYIESDIQRPIIAKVHRGLLYDPFNSPETTNELKKEWRKALDYVFNTYTPIVIGYGGGDHSLMDFLEEETTIMRHSVFWCYRKNSGLPEENIQNFIEKKNGYFVSIDGFDSLMMQIGKALYKDEITPTGTNKILHNQYDSRAERYKLKWDKLNDDPDLNKIIEAMIQDETEGEKKRAENDALTAWDYVRRGDRACKTKDYKKAVEYYASAIELGADFASYYNSRGKAYYELEDYDNALVDFSQAIMLDSNYIEAYENLGLTNIAMGDYKEAVENCSIAISLKPNFARAYNNRGLAYIKTGKYEEAIKDLSKAIELNPKSKETYLERSKVYRDIGEDELAKIDEEAADKIQKEA